LLRQSEKAAEIEIVRDDEVVPRRIRRQVHVDEQLHANSGASISSTRQAE
jgi:hypothetical protein